MAGAAACSRDPLPLTDGGEPGERPGSSWSDWRQTADARGTSDSRGDLPTVTTILTLALRANDLVHDPQRGVLYASCPSSSTVPQTANSVVTIDPATAKITDTLFVGSEPGPLALAPSGEYLYVGLVGAKAVRRVDLVTKQATLQFPVGTCGFGGDTCGPGPMAVLAGAPGTLAVSMRLENSSPSFGGVAVYDDGVRRATSTPGHTGASRLTAGEGTTLYGFNDQHTGFGFYVLTVDPSGVSVTKEVKGLVSGFSTDIVYSGEWVFASSGETVDPGTAAGPSLVGKYAANGPVAPDGRLVSFVEVPYGGPARIVVFDRAKFVQLGTVSLPKLAGAADLVRCGKDRLAFRASPSGSSGSSDFSEVWIVSSRLLE